MIPFLFFKRSNPSLNNLEGLKKVIYLLQEFYPIIIRHYILQLAAFLPSSVILTLPLSIEAHFFLSSHPIATLTSEGSNPALGSHILHWNRFFLI